METNTLAWGFVGSWLLFFFLSFGSARMAEAIERGAEIPFFNPFFLIIVLLVSITTIFALDVPLPYLFVSGVFAIVGLDWVYEARESLTEAEVALLPCWIFAAAFSWLPWVATALVISCIKIVREASRISLRSEYANPNEAPTG